MKSRYDDNLRNPARRTKMLRGNQRRIINSMFIERTLDICRSLAYKNNVRLDLLLSSSEL
jgi:hypothetical protein